VQQAHRARALSCAGVAAAHAQRWTLRATRVRARAVPLLRRAPHLPSSNAALRRRAAAFALTAACRQPPSACLVGFSAAAPKRSSFISEEPFDDMLRTRPALRARCAQPPARGAHTRPHSKS
jgi:hypothetical protein